MLVHLDVIDHIQVNIEGQDHRSKFTVTSMKNVHFSDMNAHYEVTFIWLFVEFFVLKWSVG